MVDYTNLTEVGTLIFQQSGIISFFTRLFNDYIVPTFLGVIVYAVVIFVYPFILLISVMYNDLSTVYLVFADFYNVLITFQQWYSSLTGTYVPTNMPSPWVWLLGASISISLGIKIVRMATFLKKWIPIIGSMIGGG